MTSVPKMLLISTPSDYSIDLFQNKDAARLIQPSVIEYGDLPNELNDRFDLIYLRDPFNHPGVSKDMIIRTLKELKNNHSLAYWVDGVETYEDLLIEDKWHQYQLFKDIMPSTSSFENQELKGRVIKKRISARAKGIYFSPADMPTDYKANDYITQQRLDISQELRIYMIGGKILKPAVVKTSKTYRQKVKLTDIAKDIPEEVLKMCDKVYELTNLDFMGLDIAMSAHGNYLLELNRSCQFKGYQRVTGINLATELNKYLLNKLVKNK
jgi:hypothetical protein